MFIESVWFEVLLILILILLNGFFSGSEIAVVSSQRSRISRMAGEGKKGASVVAAWLKQPEIFLATVQIGVTLVGVLASAVGGAAAVEFLKPRLQEVEMLARWAEPVAIGMVVLGITYLSLVVGELVPKSLALTHRENMAVRVAVPIRWLSKAAKPMVFILTTSTRIVLRLFGQREIPRELFVSEEEIRFMIKEGADQGIFDQTEQQMIPRVFDFADMKVKDVMMARDKIVGLEVTTPRDLLVPKVAEEGFTRLPVYEGNLDRIIGTLHMKDLIHIINLGKAIILQDLLRPPVFVPETLPAKDLLALFQKKHLHMAIVQDATGKTVGLSTLEDLMERIVGDIKDEQDVG